MSSLLEVIGPEPVVQDANDNGGFNVFADPNEDAFISMKEIDGAESADDPGDDMIMTGRGFDVVFAGDGDDVMMGGDGADFLHGGDGSDIIRGGTGDDIIIGGQDADIMMGGSGADIFQLSMDHFANGETDTVMDFEVGVDRVQINGIDPTKVTLDGKELKYNGDDGEQTILRLGRDVTGIQGEGTDEDTFELF